MTSTTRPYASTLAPGAPVGDVTPGSGAFTTLSVSTSLTSNGNWGSQGKFGKINQSGRIDFNRGSDGTTQTYIGYNSATQSTDFNIEHFAPSGVLRLRTATSGGSMTTGLFINALNNGSVGIATSPTARFHLPPGTAVCAPQKFTSGALLTVAEPGAEEFLNNDRYFTGTDGTRRRYAVNNQVITLRGYTVATLPTATQGDKAFVTDAAAPTYLAGVVGGGAIVTEVFYNGTSWVCT